MNYETEIRKLPPTNVRELSQILEYNESWKKLMAIIPKVLERNNYECDVTINNRCKYRSDDFKSVEYASCRTWSCTEILFDEWGTSGRVRPALGHLLYLLIKSELFRAADYVAVKLLKVDPPARPAEGPAALVTLPDIHNLYLQEVERILDEIDYPSSVIANLRSDSFDVNLNNSAGDNNNVPSSIPKIVVSEIPNSNRNTFTVPVVVENRRPRICRQNASTEDDNIYTVTDMIKFSRSEISSDSNNESERLSESNVVPDLSGLMSTNSNSLTYSMKTLPPDCNSNSLPAFSALNVDSKDVITEAEQNVPALSKLLSEDIPPLSDLLNSNSLRNQSDVTQQQSDLPQISLLNLSMKSDAQNLTRSENNYSMPQFSALLSDKPGSKNFLPIVDQMSEFPSETSSFTSSKNSNASSEVSQNSNLSHSSRPTCVSPLPNLSLNTQLPHFTYSHIEIATNNFDETPHKNCRQVENPFAKTNGRFLGSGAFGSVFLALNVIEKPVAVKKIFLNDLHVVSVDDTVTKQFRNEVEVLSKYKHENLLSLIGYSCDGPTYCLLYEFIPGGALKDRLQNVEEKLIWTDRLYIALGTARAVSYLHTAYTKPLIHRDIKTANILLDCSNKAKLCDFGLIKLIANQNTNTSTTAFGTSAYMAGEAFRGDVSVKLDTFSFGVVLLELITGLPPLDETREGCDIISHVQEVCEGNSIIPLIDAKAGSWVAKDINFAEELYKISSKCLEENKKKRPTMVEITDELAELIKESA